MTQKKRQDLPVGILGRDVSDLKPSHFKVKEFITKTFEFQNFNFMSLPP